MLPTSLSESFLINVRLPSWAKKYLITYNKIKGTKAGWESDLYFLLLPLASALDVTRLWLMASSQQRPRPSAEGEHESWLVGTSPASPG